MLQRRQPFQPNPKKGRIRDYRWMEIYDDEGNLLIRIGSDHELTQSEINDITQQLSTSAEEVPIIDGGSNIS